MKDKKSIVILYSKGLYDTHALQLADTLRGIGKDCHVIEISDDKYTNFGRANAARSSYIFSIRNARWMYSLYSSMTAKKKAPTKALKNIKADPMERTGINKFIYDMTSRYYKVKNILRRYEPEIVLCFTPSVLNKAIKANEQLRMYTTKIYACITDFSLDMRFFNRRASGYIVQNRSIKDELVSNGIAGEKIYVTSLISDKMKTYDKNVIKGEIGIRNDLPNLLLIGGRYGANILKSALNYMVNYTDNFNIIMLTGGSNTIVQVAKQITTEVRDKVFLIKGIDDMSKLYSLADVVISTPTTCICTEALLYNKPLVLLSGIGNVEKNNAKYLNGHGIAFDGSNKKKLMIALSDILVNGIESTAGDDKYIERGSIERVARFLLRKANDIFEEKKILIAEKTLGDAKDIDEYVIDEITDAPIEEVEVEEPNASTPDKQEDDIILDNNSEDTVIDDEYND